MTTISNVVSKEAVEIFCQNAADMGGDLNEMEDFAIRIDRIEGLKLKAKIAFTKEIEIKGKKTTLYLCQATAHGETVLLKILGFKSMETQFTKLGITEGVPFTIEFFGLEKFEKSEFQSCIVRKD